MHRYLLLAAFSIAAGYLLIAPDVQPASARSHVLLNAGEVTNSSSLGL